MMSENRRKLGEKEYPVGLPRDIQYSWRMVRDSNPRTSCPVSGFQDRRIRPLCQPSKTFFHDGSFKPAVLVMRKTLFCSYLASQSRPSHSTAASNHPKLCMCSVYFTAQKVKLFLYVDFTCVIFYTLKSDKEG